MIGKYALVHNGLNFKKIFVNRDKIGFKFGSFAKTRKFTKKVKSKK
jgi:ribosomal protein S19